MKRPLELKNPLSKHTDGYVADTHPNVSPEPESYYINKLITVALTILVLSGIIWPFYSNELEIEALVPLINPAISKTPAVTITPTITVTPVTPTTTVTPVTPTTTVTPVTPTTTTPVTPITAVPEAQPTGKKIAIKLDRSRGFLSLSQGVLTIKPGDEVVWVNDGLDRVILVSSDGLFEAKPLDSDKRMNYTFKKTGAYSFYLEGKENMTLTIIVEL